MSVFIGIGGIVVDLLNWFVEVWLVVLKLVGDNF